MKQYQTLYDVSLCVKISNVDVVTIPVSDIVSITIINNYDTSTFPIIRYRLMIDSSIIQNMLEYSDELSIMNTLNGNVYMYDTDDHSKPFAVAGASSLNINMKAYVEYKNTPTSKYDQYQNGIKISNMLNETPKVPIELFAYDKDMIYYMKRRSESVYKNMSIQSIIDDILSRGNILKYKMNVPNQQTCFDQILIPNLNILQSFSFLDQYYGIYEKGCHLYGDIDQLYITNASSDIAGNIVHINVLDVNNSSVPPGLSRYDRNEFVMTILYDNVSVLSETDIERILQAENIGAININTEDIQTASLSKLYEYQSNTFSKYGIPNILHKYENPYIASSHAARIIEKTTKIDIAFNGMDIGMIHPDTRFNIVFEKVLRGRSINGLYRPMFANHILTNENNNLFSANTAMTLCKN